MKKKIELIYSNDGYKQKNNDRDLEALVFFLLNEIGCLENSRIFTLIENWLLNSKENNLVLNVTYLEKENNMILLGSNTFDLFIEILRENFSNILLEWKILCMKKPKKIVITKNGNGITVEGKS